MGKFCSAQRKVRLLIDMNGDTGHHDGSTREDNDRSLKHTGKIFIDENGGGPGVRLKERLRR